MIRIIAPLALVLATLSVPVAAQQSIAVKSADLDLTSTHGARTLQRRVGRAVHNVCDLKVGAGSLVRHYDNACLAAATAHADRQVAMAMSKARVAQANRAGDVALSAR